MHLQMTTSHSDIALSYPPNKNKIFFQQRKNSYAKKKTFGDPKNDNPSMHTKMINDPHKEIWVNMCVRVCAIIYDEKQAQNRLNFILHKSPSSSWTQAPSEGTTTTTTNRQRIGHGGSMIQSLSNLYLLKCLSKKRRVLANPRICGGGPSTGCGLNPSIKNVGKEIFEYPDI